MGRARFVATLLIALVAFATPAAAQYEDPPTISVTPVTVGPGDEVTVIITGCGTAEGPLIVTIDGVEVGQVVPDANGDAEVTVRVPELAGGLVEVAVDCDGEVLSSMITVVVGDEAFVDVDSDDEVGGAPLPRTGSDSAGLFARVGALLLGTGALMVIVAGRRRDDVETPVHAA